MPVAEPMNTDEAIPGHAVDVPRRRRMPQAAIFDVDGTLVDSVDLHASAWQEALVKFGHDVTFEQARSQIGKGGDQFIPVFLSEDEERDHGAEMEEWRSKLFRSKYLPLVRPFSAVPELLRRVLKPACRLLLRPPPRTASSRCILRSPASKIWST
jgi:phosphoglycolate phosphatase-like HAD superfamily hydrolase